MMEVVLFILNRWRFLKKKMIPFEVTNVLIENVARVEEQWPFRSPEGVVYNSR
jgi:hypothetical protein